MNLRFYSALFIACAVSSLACAANNPFNYYITDQWNGGAAGNWNSPSWTITPGQFHGNTFPDANGFYFSPSGDPNIKLVYSDTAEIGGNARVTLSSQINIAGLVLDSGSTLDLKFFPNPNAPGQLATLFYASVDNEGTINLNPDSYFITGRFQGGGTLNLAPLNDSVTPFIPYSATTTGGILPSDVFTLYNEANHTIQGFGKVGYSNASFTNLGTISANTAGHTLALGIPGFENGVFRGTNGYNAGVLKATGGGILNIFSVDAGATYSLQQYNFSTPGADTILAEGSGAVPGPNGSTLAVPSVVNIHNLKIVGGKLLTTGAGVINLSADPGSSILLDSARYRGNTRIAADSLININGSVNMTSGILDLHGHLFVNGLTLGTASTSAALLLTKTVDDPAFLNLAINTVILAGPGSVIPDTDINGQIHTTYAAGSITLSDNASNIIRPNSVNGAQVFVAPGFAIAGAGTLQLPGHIAGTIQATGSNPLVLKCLDAFPTTGDSTAAFISNAGSELDLINFPGMSAGFANFNVASGTLTGGHYHAYGYLAFPDALSVNRADLHLYSGGRFIRAGQYSDDALAGVTSNSGAISFHAGTAFTSQSPLFNTGTVNLVGNSNQVTYPLSVYGDGTGAFTIAGNNNVLTFGQAFTGNSLIIRGINNIVNHASQSIYSIPLVVSGAGVFEVSAPGGPGSPFPSGNYTVQNGGQLVIQGGSGITTVPSGTALVLDGAASAITDGVHDLLSGVSANAGSLTLQNGHNISQPSFQNAGHLTVGENAKLTTAANYTQSAQGAITTVDGLLSSSSVVIAQGSLNGYFHINGNVQIANGALLDPGHSPAPDATITGNLNLAAGSVTKLDIGTTFIRYDSGQYDFYYYFDSSLSDHLQINGSLDVSNSILHLNLLPTFDDYYFHNEFAAPVYDGENITLFDVTGSITGKFASIQIDGMPEGETLHLSYLDHSIVGTVAPAPIPEPQTWALLAAGILGVVRRPRAAMFG